MTQAQYFDKLVKHTLHRIPRLDENNLWKKFNVEDIILSRRFGAWKITQIIFQDSSYYNVGLPDVGPQIDESGDGVV